MFGCRPTAPERRLRALTTAARCRPRRLRAPRRRWREAISRNSRQVCRCGPGAEQYDVGVREERVRMDERVQRSGHLALDHFVAGVDEKFMLLSSCLLRPF